MVSERWFLRAAQSGVLHLQTTELHVPSTSVKAFGGMAARMEVTLIHSILIWKQREQLASSNWNDTEIWIFKNSTVISRQKLNAFQKCIGKQCIEVHCETLERYIVQRFVTLSLLTYRLCWKSRVRYLILAYTFRTPLALSISPAINKSLIAAHMNQWWRFLEVEKNTFLHQFRFLKNHFWWMSGY